MSTKDNGGSAFPHPQIVNSPAACPSSPGMSLRDWFAGQALAGLLGRSYNHVRGFEKGMAAYVAEDAYVLADAMLAARKGDAE